MNLLNWVKEEFKHLESKNVTEEFGLIFMNSLYEADKEEFIFIMQATPDLEELQADSIYFAAKHAEIRTAVIKHFTDRLKDELELTELEDWGIHLDIILDEASRARDINQDMGHYE